MRDGEANVTQDAGQAVCKDHHDNRCPEGARPEGTGLGAEPGAAEKLQGDMRGGVSTLAPGDSP